MKSLIVNHTTTYRYARPVTFHEHRLMLRPRDSHDLRLIQTDLVISPTPAIRWLHDVFGNSIALATFTQPASELKIESTLRLERYPIERRALEVHPDAANFPFRYSADDTKDLGALTQPEFPDRDKLVFDWARKFVAGKTTGTLALLSDLNAGVKSSLKYEARDAEGTQTPVETLKRGAGSCRDYALLLIEAARNLGFAARFVSGYLYDEKVAAGMQGAGATHAWAEIYVPGAGWIEFDPTNGLIAGLQLIRVATTRAPHQASPVMGGFTGAPNDFLGLFVGVTVSEG